MQQQTDGRSTLHHLAYHSNYKHNRRSMSADDVTFSRFFPSFFSARLNWMTPDRSYDYHHYSFPLDCVFDPLSNVLVCLGIH